MATLEIRNGDYRTPSQFGENSWGVGMLVAALPIIILIVLFTRKK